MFSQVFVCPQGGSLSERPPLYGYVREVRILLECILVSTVLGRFIVMPKLKSAILIQFNSFHFNTRMHSSRMRTARSLAVSHRKNHTRPPPRAATHAPPEQPRMPPPNKTTHTPPNKTMHLPPNKTTHAPPK